MLQVWRSIWMTYWLPASLPRSMIGILRLLLEFVQYYWEFCRIWVPCSGSAMALRWESVWGPGSYQSIPTTWTSVGTLWCDQTDCGVLWSWVIWGRLNIKIQSYQYRDSHVKDKTVSPTVLSLTWESPYLGKMVFILRWGPGLWRSWTSSHIYFKEVGFSCVQLQSAWQRILSPGIWWGNFSQIHQWS